MVKIKGWTLFALVFGFAFLINLFVPDPIPFIDEVILLGLTIYGAYKAVR